MSYGVLNNRFAVALILPAAALSAVATGAEWTTSAGITPAITYTDNVCLSNEDEQGEWIGLLTPDISLNGTGRRANLNLSASLQLNTLSDSKLEDLGCNPSGFSDRNQFFPRLNAGGNAILIEDWFYIDASANVDQNEGNPFGPGAGDELNRTGNTNTTVQYSVSPYISRRFKNVAELDLRYSWNDQYNTQDIVGDSQQQNVDFSLQNGPASGAVQWGLEANYNIIDYSDTPGRETGDTSELKSAQINLGYQLTRVLQINGFYGDEKNDFVSTLDEIDGAYWDTGIRWTPNSRTSVEVGIGNRFFGDTQRFSISHVHRRSTFQTSYSEDLTYDRNIRTIDDSIPLAGGQTGDAVDNIPGQPQDVSGNSTSLSNSPILDRRFSLSYAYSGRKNNLGISASHSDQTRAEDGRDAIFINASVSWGRNVSRNTSVNATLGWSETTPEGERSEFISDSESWTFRLGAQRQLAQNFNMNLDYQYTDRQSELATNEYTENRITLGFRYGF